MSNAKILKDKTKDLHNHVELVMNSALLFSNQFTVSHYHNFIQKSYNYVHFLNNLTTNNWQAYNTVLQQKEQALCTDMQHLNVLIKPDAALSVLSQNKHFQLGLIYIVLGAMLGNKVILNKLKQTPAFANFPFAYLSHRQENLSELWTAFQAQVNALNHEELEQVIAGAKKGYQLFSS